MHRWELERDVMAVRIAKAEGETQRTWLLNREAAGQDVWSLIAVHNMIQRSQ